MPRPSKLKAEITVEGLPGVADLLKSIGYRAAKSRPLMERMAVTMQAQQARRMHEKPWQPLTEGTVARKEHQHEIAEVFRDEARPIRGTPTRVPEALYYGVTMPGFPGQIRMVTRASATFGLDSKGKGPFFYARLVQNVKGTKRRILAISEADALVLTEMTARWIYVGWGKSTPYGGVKGGY